MDQRTTTIECDACGASNRVPLSRLKDRPKCGKCKAPLPLGGGPITVTDANFDETIATSPVPVIVDFWAPWCGPCRMIGPTLESLAGKMAHDVLIAKLNVDENPRVASKFQVRSIPMLLGFVDGEAVDSQIGALPPSALESWVRRVVDKGRLMRD
jgi:thioredoxin 2